MSPNTIIKLYIWSDLFWTQRKAINFATSRATFRSRELLVPFEFLFIIWRLCCRFDAGARRILPCWLADSNSASEVWLFANRCRQRRKETTNTRLVAVFRGNRDRLSVSNLTYNPRIIIYQRLTCLLDEWKVFRRTIWITRYSFTYLLQRQNHIFDSRIEFNELCGYRHNPVNHVDSFLLLTMIRFFVCLFVCSFFS